MPPKTPRGKKVLATVKLHVQGGNATPAPPVGPALGQHGVNIMEFCKAYNARTQSQAGLVVPAVVTIYQDRTFTFETKTPPAAVLLKKVVGIAKGSGEPNRTKVGKVTRAQMEEVAKAKMVDLNTDDLDQAVSMIAGTARNMGLEIEE